MPIKKQQLSLKLKIPEKKYEITSEDIKYDYKEVIDILKHTTDVHLDKLYLSLPIDDYKLVYNILGFTEEKGKNITRIFIFINKLFKNNIEQKDIPNRLYYRSSGTSRSYNNISGYYLLFSNILNIIDKPEDNIRISFNTDYDNIITSNETKVEQIEQLKNLKIKHNIDNILKYGRLLNETNSIISKLLYLDDKRIMINYKGHGELSDNITLLKIINNSYLNFNVSEFIKYFKNNNIIGYTFPIYTHLNNNNTNNNNNDNNMTMTMNNNANTTSIHKFLTSKNISRRSGKSRGSRRSRRSGKSRGSRRSRRSQLSTKKKPK
jgi:hypothetical protein